ncbi:MAG TPA: hypothetical protein VFO28_14520 [Burkholderiaceae bacterium]|nr:hypothetical protein [Burkholderiaceae bacterium]
MTTRTFWRAALVWRLALLATFWPLLAHGQAADDAVDAVVTVGRFAGVTITPADAPMVKALVHCGLQGRTMLDCARSQVIEQLPPAARPVAHCVTLGIAIDACGSPEALRQLPVSARALSRCIGTRTAVGTCAELVAIAPQQRQLLRVIDKLQADGRGDDAVKPVAMQRLVELAAAMRDGDWDQVARIGGPEVHKVALRGASKTRGRQA